ncbi:MAG: hypothetical protein ACXWK3_11110 [Reyranella sp.]
MLSRRLAIAALCALPVAARAQMQSPQTFLQSIYEPYLKAGFKGQPYWQVDHFFVSDLARAIDADMREAKRRVEVPKLDGDPFLDAQEWDIENLAISVKADGPKATGEVSFDNFGKRTQVALDLVQTPAGWRIADIKGPSGSLSALYK